MSDRRQMNGRIPFTIRNQKDFTVSELIKVLTEIERRGAGDCDIFLNYDDGSYCSTVEIDGDNFEDAAGNKVVTVKLGT